MSPNVSHVGRWCLSVIGFPEALDRLWCQLLPPCAASHSLPLYRQIQLDKAVSPHFSQGNLFSNLFIW